MYKLRWVSEECYTVCVKIDVRKETNVIGERFFGNIDVKNRFKKRSSKFRIGVSGNAMEGGFVKISFGSILHNNRNSDYERYGLLGVCCTLIPGITSSPFPFSLGISMIKDRSLYRH